MSTMLTIASRQNPTLKHIAKLLSSSKYRREQGLAVAEGIHVAQCIVQSGFGIELTVAAESAMQNQEVIELLGSIDTKNSSLVMVKDSVFSAVSDIGVSGGVLAIFQIPEPQLTQTIDTDTVLLEDIQDPGNIGTLLRSVAAAGVRRVFLSEACASPWSPKALRAGMGAQFSLDITTSANLGKLISSSRVPVLATSLQTNESLYSLELTNPVAWLFGNEGQGVTSELLSLVTKQVIIPQAKNTVESLNVAASAAVCLFEQHRQRIISKKLV